MSDGLELVDEERARVLVGRTGRDADEAHPARPVAHPEGEVDVPARADDDGLHGAAPARTITGSARACPRPGKRVRSNRMNTHDPRRRACARRVLLAALLFAARSRGARLAREARAGRAAEDPRAPVHGRDPVPPPRRRGPARRASTSRSRPSSSTPRRSRCSLRGDADLLYTGTSQGWENRLGGSPIVIVGTGVWGVSSLVGQGRVHRDGSPT